MAKTTKNWDQEVAELHRLEEPVNKSESDSVHARWVSGRYLLTLREGEKPHVDCSPGCPKKSSNGRKSTRGWNSR